MRTKNGPLRGAQRREKVAERRTLKEEKCCTVGSDDGSASSKGVEPCTITRVTRLSDGEGGAARNHTSKSQQKQKTFFVEDDVCIVHHMNSL